MLLLLFVHLLDNMSRKTDTIQKVEVPRMQTMTVGHFKAHFSEVLDLVQQGEDIVISYGKKKAKIAVLVPFDRYEGTPVRTLGILAGKASFSVSDDFKLNDDELLAL
jgi:prevent-host-death family protein